MRCRRLVGASIWPPLSHSEEQGHIDVRQATARVTHSDFDFTYSFRGHRMDVTQQVFEEEQLQRALEEDRRLGDRFRQVVVTVPVLVWRNHAD
jgi:hypothetical protein